MWLMISGATSGTKNKFPNRILFQFLIGKRMLLSRKHKNIFVKRFYITYVFVMLELELFLSTLPSDLASLPLTDIIS